jgi:hypothetical protein
MANNEGEVDEVWNINLDEIISRRSGEDTKHYR